MNLVLIGIVVYVLLQLFIGLLVSRRIRTGSDYLLAGRRLGYALAAFSMFATWFGAEACIGVAGAAYRDGLAGVTADPFGYGVGLLLMGFVFAVPLWKMGLNTVADFFRVRYSESLAAWVAAIMIPSSLLWAAAQIRAFGQVLSATLDLPAAIGMTSAAVLVIVYTASGGLLADAMTDVVQGIVLIAGLAVLVPEVIGKMGGFPTALAALSADPVAAVPSIPNGPARTLHLLQAWMIPVGGSILTQELVSRVLASRTPEIARRASLLAGGSYLLIGFIPVTLGLLGAQLLPGLKDPEQILPLLGQRYLSPVLYILFVGALISAILSTVDSTLLAASALFTNDVLFRRYPDLGEPVRLRLQRMGVIVAGVIAYGLSLFGESTYSLVEDSSALGGGGILAVFLFGFFTKIGGPRSATAAMATGVSVWVAAEYLFHLELGFLLALAASIGVYVVTAALRLDARPEAPVKEESALSSGKGPFH